MTTVLTKSKRAQPLFLSGFVPGTSDVYTNVDIEIVSGDFTVEVLEDIEVVVCQED